MKTKNKYKTKSNENNPYRLRGKICRELLLRMIGQFPNLLINSDYAPEKLHAELWAWLSNEFVGCEDDEFHAVANGGFGLRMPLSLTKKSEKQKGT